LTKSLQNKLDEKFKITRKHLEILKGAFTRLHETFGSILDRQVVERVQEDEHFLPYLDQIAYRFTKLQEELGKTVRLFLMLKGEEAESLPMIDLINLAEKRGLSISAEKWWELRRLRNVLVHEYPDETEEVAWALHSIEKALLEIESLLREMERNFILFRS